MFERINLIKYLLYLVASTNLLVFSFFLNIIRSYFKEARLDTIA